MSGEVATREDLKELRSSLEKKIDALTGAMRELIRIDGDIKRVQDVQTRIGKQVDTHEVRLRDLEIAHPSSQRTNRLLDNWQERILSALVGGGVLYFVQHFLK